MHEKGIPSDNILWNRIPRNENSNLLPNALRVIFCYDLVTPKYPFIIIACDSSFLPVGDSTSFIYYRHQMQGYTHHISTYPSCSSLDFSHLHCSSSSSSIFHCFKDLLHNLCHISNYKNGIFATQCTRISV